MKRVEASERRGVGASRVESKWKNEIRKNPVK
jgi:hypothetical protein